MGVSRLSQVKLPDESSYNLSVPFVVGTGSTAGTWLGSLEGLTEYYDGLLILYKPSVKGASTTTLNINSLGAKTCYLNNTTKLTTHFPANQPILLAYSTSQNSGCWECIDNYDSNSDTYDRNRYKASVKAGTSALVAANIIVGKDGVFNHLKSGGAFDISYPILYLNEAVAANGTTTNIYDIIHFTVTTTQSISLTAYLPVYIRGTLSGNIFTPISTTPLTQTVPTTADNYYYMYLGNATAATTIYLQEIHPIYAYKNGKFGLVANDASSVNGHTIDKDVPSDAVFTDHTYSGTGLISVNSSGVISTTAEVNQNAFSNIKVGSTTVAADTKTDTLELAGSNVTLTPDATNDKVTIGITSSNVTTALGYTPYNSTNPNGYTKVESSTNGKIKIDGTDTTVYTHPGSGTNPHGTTAADVNAIPTSSKGTANGVAELDANGLVPTSQLPSFVDDVLEYSSKSAFPATGETGKIYVALDTNLTYRWSGTAYVEISPSLALGETSSTAYRGDRGKIAYDHSQSTHARTDATAVSFTRNLTSGTKIGAITIDGTKTNLYCETNTDTAVTSSANHYTPSTASGQDKTASASGATAAWSIDVVKGVTLNTDGKGHVTGLSVTSGKIPANPNTDTEVAQYLSTSNVNRPLLLSYADNESTTSPITNCAIRSNNIYANGTTGTVSATKYRVGENVTLEYNSTTQSLDFVFA